MDFCDVTINLTEFFLRSVFYLKDMYFPLKIDNWTSDYRSFSEQVGTVVIKSSVDYPTQFTFPKSAPSKRTHSATHPSIEPKRGRISSNRVVPHNPVTAARPGSSSGIKKPILDVSDMFAECILAGEKVFVCGVCNYKSNVKHNMRKHVECMHSDNPPCFRCSTCGTSFREKNKLKGHYMKTHNLEEPVAKAAAAMAVSNR